MFDDTYLMRLVLRNLAQKHKWTYEETIDKFFHSDTCKSISDKETGYFTFSHMEIIELFEEEIGVVA
jgi:hypothetical protein